MCDHCLLNVFSLLSFMELYMICSFIRTEMTKKLSSLFPSHYTNWEGINTHLCFEGEKSATINVNYEK